MKIAILYENRNIYVELSPEAFQRQLEEYVERDGKSVVEAMKLIIKDLKQVAKRR